MAPQQLRFLRRSRKKKSASRRDELIAKGAINTGE
jgi:hypothetical protein